MSMEVVMMILATATSGLVVGWFGSEIMYGVAPCCQGRQSWKLYFKRELGAWAALLVTQSLLYVNLKGIGLDCSVAGALHLSFYWILLMLCVRTIYQTLRQLPNVLADKQKPKGLYFLFLLVYIVATFFVVRWLYATYASLVEKMV